jgi:hypothetical protein
MSRPEIAIHKKYPNGKHEETRYVKRTQKITQCLLNYKLFKKLKEDNLQLRNPQRLMAFKIEQLLLNGQKIR